MQKENEKESILMENISKCTNLYLIYFCFIVKLIINVRHPDKQSARFRTLACISAQCK